ncbi:hypothetical protein ANN_14294 [Periplaneta americana]|uniref:Uncharacterized protein n=1 Tax=Periplaneta americana TaxID=6978 RepID=A0ABQ8SXD7_PERAM|nr:hypothetical protein ANN_14294 [Periplaneta americana]
MGRAELDMQPPPRGEFWVVSVQENETSKELHLFLRYLFLFIYSPNPQFHEPPLVVRLFDVCPKTDYKVAHREAVSEKPKRERKEMAQFIIELTENSCTGMDWYEETTLDVREGRDCDSNDSDTNHKTLAPATGNVARSSSIFESDSESPEASDTNSQSPCKSSSSSYVTTL